MILLYYVIISYHIMLYYKRGSARPCPRRRWCPSPRARAPVTRGLTTNVNNGNNDNDTNNNDNNTNNNNNNN